MSQTESPRQFVATFDDAGNYEIALPPIKDLQQIAALGPIVTAIKEFGERDRNV